MERKHELRDSPARLQYLRTRVFLIAETVGGVLKRPIGTGFFVSTHGLFVTAKHVLAEVIDEAGIPTGGLSVFQLFDGDRYVYRPISRFTTNSVSDVAIGFLAPMSQRATGEHFQNDVLRLAKDHVKLGDFVATYAYPKTETSTAEAGVTIDARPTEFCGIVQELLPDGRDKISLPGPCFRTDMKLLDGTSGGPVLNEKGLVVGVNSRGWEFSDGGDDLSYISPIQDVFRFTLSGITVPWKPAGTDIDMRELAEHGFLLLE